MRPSGSEKEQVRGNKRMEWVDSFAAFIRGVKLNNKEEKIARFYWETVEGGKKNEHLATSVHFTFFSCLATVDALHNEPSPEKKLPQNNIIFHFVFVHFGII